MLGPQQNTPMNNLYWYNALPENKTIQSLEMMLPMHCFSHYLVVVGGKSCVEVSSCVEHSISINMLKISSSAEDFLNFLFSVAFEVHFRGKYFSSSRSFKPILI